MGRRIVFAHLVALPLYILNGTRPCTAFSGQVCGMTNALAMLE